MIVSREAGKQGFGLLVWKVWGSLFKFPAGDDRFWLSVRSCHGPEKLSRVGPCILYCKYMYSVCGYGTMDRKWSKQGLVIPGTKPWLISIRARVGETGCAHVVHFLHVHVVTTSFVPDRGCLSWTVCLYGNSCKCQTMWKLVGPRTHIFLVHI